MSQFELEEVIKEIVKYSPFYIQSLVINDFIKNSIERLFDPELKMIVECVSSTEQNKYLHFLLEVGFYCNEEWKEKIMSYVIEKCPEDLRYYPLAIYHLIRYMKCSTEKKIEWVEFFSGKEYHELHENIHRELGTKEWYDVYIKNFRLNKELKKENEHLKSKIQLLEAHIQFMPDGDGYLEAKKNFESLAD